MRWLRHGATAMLLCTSACWIIAGTEDFEDVRRGEVGGAGGTGGTAAGGGSALGDSCTDATECMSGSCVDGVCCDGPCDDACQQCGEDGVCGMAAVGPDPRAICVGEGVCDSIGACAEGDYLFGSMYGGTLDDDMLSIAVGSDESWVIGGGAIGSWMFGAARNAPSGGQDLFVGKLDDAGQPIWNYRFGSPATDYIRHIVLDEDDDIYFGGYVDDVTSAFAGQGAVGAAGNRTGIIGKLTKDGSEVWLVDYGVATSDQIHQLAYDPVADAVIGVGEHDGLFFVKLDATTGAELDLTQFGSGGGDDGIFGVAVAGDGTVAITGFVQGAVDFGGGMLTATATRPFVAVFDGERVHSWSAVFDAAEGVGHDVVFEADGGVTIAGYVTGRSAGFGGDVHTVIGGRDAFVARFAPDGTYRHSIVFGSPGDQEVQGLARDTAGNIVAAGVFEGDLGIGDLSSTGGFDALALKLTPELDLLWARGLGDGADQFARGLAETADGYVFAASGRGSVAVPGGGTETSAGGLDIFLFELSR